jgi:hypothetical protein
MKYRVTIIPPSGSTTGTVYDADEYQIRLEDGVYKIDFSSPEKRHMVRIPTSFAFAIDEGVECV